MERAEKLEMCLHGSLILTFSIVDEPDIVRQQRSSDEEVNCGDVAVDEKW